MVLADDDQLPGFDVLGGGRRRRLVGAVSVVSVAVGDNGLKCPTGGGGGCVALGSTGGSGNSWGVQGVG